MGQSPLQAPPWFGHIRTAQELPSPPRVECDDSPITTYEQWSIVQ